MDFGDVHHTNGSNPKRLDFTLQTCRQLGLNGKHCNLMQTSAKSLGGKQVVYELPDLATQ